MAFVKANKQGWGSLYTLYTLEIYLKNVKAACYIFSASVIWNNWFYIEADTFIGIPIPGKNSLLSSLHYIVISLSFTAFINLFCRPKNYKQNE